MTPNTKKAIKNLGIRPPRLNERVLIGTYQTYEGGDLHSHASAIRKCGLTSEIVCESGKVLYLYAIRRQADRKVSV